MVDAALEIGKASGALAPNARQADVRRMLAAALSEMASKDRGPRYDLWVQAPFGTEKARFLGVTERRCYYRVETEEGQALVVHGNDIQASRGKK